MSVIFTDNSEYSRLLWQCRRGMLELELLLREFVQHDYEPLNQTLRSQFRDLLTLPDPVLFDLLMGTQEVQDEGLRNIVHTIRKATRQRFKT